MAAVGGGASRVVAMAATALNVFADAVDALWAPMAPITPVTILLAAMAVGVWGLALFGSGRRLAIAAAAVPAAVGASDRTSRVLSVAALVARRSVVASAWASVASAVLLYRRGSWARLIASWLSTSPLRRPSTMTSAPDAALAAAEDLLTAAVSRHGAAAAAVDAAATTLRGLRVEVEAWVADVDGEVVSLVSPPATHVSGSHGATATERDALATRTVEAATRAAGEALARRRVRRGARQREAAALRRRLADVGARIAEAVRLLLPEYPEGVERDGRVTLRGTPHAVPFEGATDSSDGAVPAPDDDDERPASAAAAAAVQRQAAMVDAVSAAAAALPSPAAEPVTPLTPTGRWARGGVALEHATPSPPSVTDPAAAAAAADRKRVVAAASRSAWSSRADATGTADLVAAMNEMAAWRSAPYEERSRQIRMKRAALSAARLAQLAQRESSGTSTAATEGSRRVSVSSSVNGGEGRRARHPSRAEGSTSSRRTDLALPSAPHLSRSSTAVVRLPHLPHRLRRGGSEQGVNDRLGVGATAPPAPVPTRGGHESGGGGGDGGGSSHSGESSGRLPSITPLRKLWRRTRPSEPLLPPPPLVESAGISFRGAAAIDSWPGAATDDGEGATSAVASGRSDAPVLAVDGWAPPPPPPPPPSPPMMGEGGSGSARDSPSFGGGGGDDDDVSGLSAAIRRARVGAWLRASPAAVAHVGVGSGARASGGSSTVGGAGSGLLPRLRRGGGRHDAKGGGSGAP
ncbi:hypothetical protein MMPV_009168 [Pyropia vietnamensis]